MSFFALTWETTGLGEKAADSSVQTTNASVGPSSGVRTRRVSRRARRHRKTTTARIRKICAAKIETGHVAAQAASRPSWMRSRVVVAPTERASVLDLGFVFEHDRE